MSDRRTRLEEARDVLAGAIRACESNRDLAPLVREYRQTMADLDALPNEAEVSAADEIAQRRAHRRAGAPRPASAAYSG